MSIKGWLLRSLAVRSNVRFDRSFHVGPGSVVWAPVELRIGRNVYVGKHVTIEVDGEIGDGVLIANNVGIVGRTDHDMRAVGTTIRSAPWVGDDPDRLSQPTMIGSDVWIGFGAVVLSGVRIGDSAVVAAGSVVTRDVPANAVVAGVPARVVGERMEEGVFQRHWEALAAQGVRRLVADA